MSVKDCVLSLGDPRLLMKPNMGREGREGCFCSECFTIRYNCFDELWYFSLLFPLEPFIYECDHGLLSNLTAMFVTNGISLGGGGGGRGWIL